MSVPTRPARLLNPGPVTISDRVRGALSRPDICHREPEFAELQAEVRERLTAVYDGARDRFECVLLTGSGTAAVESMVGSLVAREDHVLVAANGVYGERIAAILEAQGKPHRLLPAAWLDPLDVSGIRETLAEGGFSHVAVVHHETTTGRLNALQDLDAACAETGAALLVDAVSSFGGEGIDFGMASLEAVAATGNKCLHGVPGTSFVLARRTALETRRSGSPSLYLDLFRHHAEQTRGSLMFTPAVQSLYALREALEELDERGGWRSRHARYAALSHLLRAGMRARGVELLLEHPDSYGSSLSSFTLPGEIRFGDLYPGLKERGFVIYPGQRALAETIFRVAVMGELTDSDIREFLDAFSEVTAVAGIPRPS